LAGLLWLLLLTSPGAEAELAAFAVDAIEADGVKLPRAGESLGPVKLPSNTRSLDVTFGPVRGASAVPLRFRYQLEGYDRGWRDPIGVMRFAVRFNDAAENTISGEEFDAHGESAGWTGAPETARFKERQETLEVPQGATRLQLWLSSAGPQQTMGIYAVERLVVTFVPSAPAEAERSVEMVSPTGSLMDTNTGTPAGWARHGTSLGIARIWPRPGKPPLIVMRDDRPDAFGGWLTRGAKELSLEGVSKIRLNWTEAYSVGWGGNARVSFPYLPAGDYRLRLQALTVEGKPQGGETVLRLAVVPPFYQTRAFWICCAALGATFLGLLVRQATRRRMQRRLDVLVGERAVERERSRIARDLHDNLGADLTHLALLSDLAQADAGDVVKAKLHFDQIFDLAQSLTRQVDEMVWAVNPANDSLRGFVPFLSNFAQNYLRAAGIPCRLDLPAALEDAPLSSAQRHHLFLTVKEALHNIVKHSGATEAWLLVRLVGGQLAIRVEDNGRGISGGASGGDGTGNMQQRIESIGGRLERTSTGGRGTAVSVTLPLVPHR
jgi:signal transduction histidine kinase